MMPPQCFDCKHFGEQEAHKPLRCEAFPDGIPQVILRNLHNHLEAFPGDHGIRFEPSESAIELGLRLPSGEYPASHPPVKSQV